MPNMPLAGPFSIVALTLEVRAQRLGPSQCVSLVLFRLLGTASTSGLPFRLTPRVLAAAIAPRVRSPIMCRSCSAAAAST